MDAQNNLIMELSWKLKRWVQDDLLIIVLNKFINFSGFFGLVYDIMAMC